MRLINAEKLRAEAIESCKFCHLNGGKYCREKCEINALTKLIDNAPTVDTNCPHCDSGYAQGYSDGYLKGKEDRPQGRWLFSRCDKCGAYHDGMYRSFCPNCGAYMRGGANNEKTDK